jgi:uncharacterized protein YqeY
MYVVKRRKKEMLIDQIKQAQVEARKSRNTLAATLLTTLLGEANMVAKNAQRDTPTDEEVTVVVKKFLKGNLETQSFLANGSNPEALETVKAEQVILEVYLPKQLSEEELVQIVSAAILAGTASNVGALMGFLKANHSGKYDGKIASAAVKTALAV